MRRVMESPQCRLSWLCRSRTASARKSCCRSRREGVLVRSGSRTQLFRCSAKISGVGALWSSSKARRRSPESRPPGQSRYSWGYRMRWPWPRLWRVQIVQSRPKVRSMCRRSARVSSVRSLMELRAGARAMDVGCASGGGRSSWASVGGPAVGGVEGWQRSMMFGAAWEAGVSVVATCGEL